MKLLLFQNNYFTGWKNCSRSIDKNINCHFPSSIGNFNEIWLQKNFPKIIIYFQIKLKIPRKISFEKRQKKNQCLLSFRSPMANRINTKYQSLISTNKKTPDFSLVKKIHLIFKFSILCSWFNKIHIFLTKVDLKLRYFRRLLINL